MALCPRVGIIMPAHPTAFFFVFKQFKLKEIKIKKLKLNLPNINDVYKPMSDADATIVQVVFMGVSPLS